MRKYRYTDPRSFAGKRYAIGQFAKFFIGWNIVGYCLWAYMKSATSKKDPEFNTKSTNEKILSMMGYRDVKPVTYQLKIGTGGISVEKKPTDSYENDNLSASDSSESQHNATDGTKTNR